MGRAYSKKDNHPKYDYELFRRPVIAHILQGENIKRKTQLLSVLQIYKIKVSDYESYVQKTEELRERDHGR